MVQAGTSDQIRSMLDRHPPTTLDMAGFDSLDRTMRRQREKYGELATEWWFGSGRAYWSAVAQRNESAGVGSVGR